MSGRRAQSGSVYLEGDTWRVRYREPAKEGGKRRRCSMALGSITDIPDRDSARRAADRALERVAPRRLAQGASPLWSEWCDRFVATYVPLLRPSSQASITSIIAVHLKPAFTNLHVHELDKAQLQGFVSAQARDGADLDTIRTRYAVLRRMLRKADADGLAARPPAPRSIEFGRAVRVKANVAEKAFTADEMRQILDAAEQPWSTLYAVMAFAGLRISEALGLDWKNVDLEARVLKVRQSGVMGAVQLPKTERSIADLWISEPLLNILRAFREASPDVRGLLFPGPSGAPRWSSGVRKHHLNPLLKRLGLRHRSFHGFRHGAAFSMFGTGSGATAVRDSLRHSSIAITELYAGSDAASRRAAFDGAASLVSPRAKPDEWTDSGQAKHD